MKHHEHKISSENEKKTLFVIILTSIAMLFEIILGYYTHSMALLADGFHMLCHALAFILAYCAYILVRKYQNSPLFINGSEKISVLSAYTSSLFLGLGGFWIIIEAFLRFLNPCDIKFEQAIFIAVIGLVVNLICIFIMENKEHHKKEKDYNFLAAYYHILADIMTSIFAIAALLAGKYFGLIYLDSIIGILGGILIIKWAYSLIKSTVKILIDLKTF